MASDRAFIRFLSWAAASAAGAALLVTLLVLVVDPYRLYGLVEGDFNRVKPRPERFRQEIKLAHARALGANVFLMGNSRVEVGFDPDHPLLAAPGRTAYNLAIAGTPVGAARDELDYLRARNRQPSVVVLGLEFLDFLLDPALPQPRVRRARAEHGADRLAWQAEALFSLTSVLDALETLRIQRRPGMQTISARGFTPLDDYRRHASESGYRALFHQRALENGKSYLRKPHGLLPPDGGPSIDFDELRAFMDGALDAPAEVHLLIYPYHAQILAMFEQLGFWPQFEQWKSLLAREVDTARAAHPGARITLWDFSGFSPLQCETIPAAGDLRASTRWYWEAGHFKPALGGKVLTRLLAAPAPGEEGFGFALTGATLEQNRARIAAERSGCQQRYPALFSEVTALLREAGGVRE
ncbi:MAG: hypothetical protein V4754_00045 [Pseudomonadota bacterium]